MNKLTRGVLVFQVFNNLLMAFLMAIMIYPLLYVLFASLSQANLLMAHEGILLKPLGVTLGAYRMVFKNKMIMSGYLNTLIVVTVGLIINLSLTSLGAYFLSRRNVKLQKYVMKFVVFTMFFNGGLIPFYYVVRGLGLYDKLWALVLPVAISTFNMIIMRTSFMGIPQALEESAKIDGAGHFTILTRIVLPLSGSTIAVIALYYAVAHWNSWFNASIFLRNRSLYPLQLILREILIQNDTNTMMQGVGDVDRASVSETVKYAVIIVATLPILFVYPFIQKYFVKGVLIGSVKG